MNLIRYLLEGWPRLSCVALIANLAGGTGMIALFFFLVHIVGGQGKDQEKLLVFFSMLVTLLVGRAASRLLFSKLSSQAIMRLRRDISMRLLKAPFAQLEKIGQARIDAALLSDAGAVSMALPLLIQMAVNFLVIAGGLYYLDTVRPKAVLLVLGVIALGVPLYLLLRRHTRRLSRSAEKLRERIFANFSTFSRGIKELKLHSERRQHFVERHLNAAFLALHQKNNRQTGLSVLASISGQTLVFLVVGWLVFGDSAVPLSSAARAGIVVLYLMGPLDAFLSGVGSLSEGGGALRRIQHLLNQLEIEPDRASTKPGVSAPPQEISYVNVLYRHIAGDDEAGFTLGPLSINLQAGKITYLVGGNGSGKSTFLKLGTGLYWPDSGEIKIDGRTIAKDEREQLRAMFTAIYDDYHLFEEVLPYDETRFTEADIRAILARFKLDKHIKLVDGAFSVPPLSRGQRKRVALLNAFLDDRPVFVFDEWAADQEPYFKNLFYRSILPELKQRGKAVLVITHDDQYFDAADEIVRLQNGRIVTESNASIPELLNQVR